MTRTHPSAILIVNDRSADLLALREALLPLGEAILTADTATEALQLAETNDIAVAIVDIRMPAIDGFELVETLRRDPQRGDLPIIFVSAFDVTPEIADRVYALGAADLVLLPVMPKMLQSKVSVFVRLHQQATRERAYAVEVRQAAATEVQMQQERFQLLVESVSDYALFFLDPLGLISDWTVSAERLLGYAAAEVVGRHFRLLFIPEDRAKGAPEEELENALTQGQAHDDTFHVRGDGTRVPVNGRTIALKDRDGRLRGFAKIMRDATHLLALRESEAKFREIFETASEGIWMLDANMVITTANHRMAELLGVGLDELIGRRKSAFAFPEDLDYVNALFDARRLGKVESGTEVRFRHRSGVEIWTLLSGRPVYRDGRFAGALDMFTDITARKAAERELADSRTRLRLAIEIADLGVFFQDGAAGVMSWSPQVKRLLGMQAEEPASIERFLSRVHPEDVSHVKATLERVFSARADTVEWEQDYRVVWPDGTLRWLRSNGVSNAQAGLTQFHLIGTVRDVTAEKEFAAELGRQIAERTRELDEKNRQLESFAYTVAHDLRAPLRAINGYADFALEDVAAVGRPQTVDYLERIRRSTKRLDALISDLLAYSRLNQQPVHLERVDLHAVVTSVLREFEGEVARTGAEIRVALDTRPHFVEAEPSILQQVLFNLVGNALKFTRPGEPPRVEIGAEPHDARVRLTVRDEGIGIPREYHGRIFKVFERLQSSRAYPGTGIGLAIVARGMERMGGGYGVESEPGQGSTFWIELKLSGS